MHIQAEMNYQMCEAVHCTRNEVNDSTHGPTGRELWANDWAVSNQAN